MEDQIKPKSIYTNLITKICKIQNNQNGDLTLSKIIENEQSEDLQLHGRSYIYSAVQFQIRIIGKDFVEKSDKIS